MTAAPPTALPLLEAWRQAVRKLEEEISGWCEGQGWTVTSSETNVMDVRPQYGLYVIPSLSIETPHGRLIVDPMVHALDGTGMVQLYAWPTLYRVRLLSRGGNVGWEILTDSGIPLHQDWNEQTFLTLAKDLLKADY